MARKIAGSWRSVTGSMVTITHRLSRWGHPQAADAQDPAGPGVLGEPPPPGIHEKAGPEPRRGQAHADQPNARPEAVLPDRPVPD